MDRLLIAFLAFSMPVWSIPTPTPTPMPGIRLGPGPIVSLWRALPNPASGESQKILIVNVGDSIASLEGKTIKTQSSQDLVALTGSLSPGHTRFITLPTQMLNNTVGDIVYLSGGGAIYRGRYDGPIGLGRWVQLRWTSKNSFGLALSKILPNSTGDDDNTGFGEKIWITNQSSESISLQNWKIQDRAETWQIIALSGTIAAGEELEFENKSGTSIFNNQTPDCILLLNPDGIEVDSGTYVVPAEQGVPTDFIPCQ